MFHRFQRSQSRLSSIVTVFFIGILALCGCRAPSPVTTPGANLHPASESSSPSASEITATPSSSPQSSDIAPTVSTMDLVEAIRRLNASGICSAFVSADLGTTNYVQYGCDLSKPTKHKAWVYGSLTDGGSQQSSVKPCGGCTVTMVGKSWAIVARSQADTDLIRKSIAGVSGAPDEWGGAPKQLRNNFRD
ncbi:hypothetical protein J2S90_002567 [Arthrobacter bambusae]|uniref:Lipoprotein n=1 Tax=Arthrobacter bambusae TaxID=1338426 RepID=A0AAW8DIU9_9MICC|nr:hypothetical protein [Arthrobacter bambusae]MDQ0127322.1 hypothetical protein [Arthrobacter bambusae]MDQ0178664.1 hypothetical protein [Arthrobacter bambusae]